MQNLKFIASIIIISVLVIMMFIIGFFYFINTDNQDQPVILKTQSASASSDKSISSFIFAELNPEVNGVITQENHTVTLTVPYGTNITSLAPTIEVSPGASLSPASGVPQNFKNTIVYKVSGADTTHQDYTVNITISGKPILAITNFTIAGQTGNTVINQDNHSIFLSVPSGMDITNITPNVGLIVGASISPTSDVPQDFTKPVTYTITTSDKIQQKYMVTVTIADN